MDEIENIIDDYLNESPILVPKNPEFKRSSNIFEGCSVSEISNWNNVYFQLFYKKCLKHNNIFNLIIVLCLN